MRCTSIPCYAWDKGASRFIMTTIRRESEPSESASGGSDLWVLGLEVDQRSVPGIRDPQAARVFGGDTAGQEQCAC